MYDVNCIHVCVLLSESYNTRWGNAIIDRLLFSENGVKKWPLTRHGSCTTFYLHKHKHKPTQPDFFELRHNYNHNPGCFVYINKIQPVLYNVYIQPGLCTTLYNLCSSVWSKFLSKTTKNFEKWQNAEVKGPLFSD